VGEVTSLAFFGMWGEEVWPNFKGAGPPGIALVPAMVSPFFDVKSVRTRAPCSAARAGVFAESRPRQFGSSSGF